MLLRGKMRDPAATNKNITESSNTSTTAYEMREEEEEHALGDENGPPHKAWWSDSAPTLSNAKDS